MELTQSSTSSVAPLMVESFPLRLTSILNRQLEISESDILVSGSHSHLSLAILLAQHPGGAFNTATHVLILPNEDEALKLKRAILQFDPQIDISFLPAFDVGPYSTLHPNSKVLCERLGFLHKARNARPGQLFIATSESLMQRTLPCKVLSDLTFNLKKNDSLPDGLNQKLLMMGYTSVPVVEDVGTFSIRGSIVDIFSPAFSAPFRFELFGDIIDSIRTFDPATQRSLGDAASATVIPAREALFYNENRQMAAQKLQASAQDRNIDREELKELLRSISLGQSFYGMDFLLASFYKELESPLEFFNEKTYLWRVDHVDALQAADAILADLKKQFEEGEKLLIRPKPDELYSRYDQLTKPLDSREILFERIDFADSTQDADEIRLEYRSFSISEFSASCLALNNDQDKLFDYVARKFTEWKSQNYRLLVFSHSRTLAQRMQLLFEKCGFEPVIASENEYLWSDWLTQQRENPKLIHIIPRALGDSGRWPEEEVIFVRDDDIWGRKKPSRQYKKEGTLEDRVHALSFGDLKPGDLIVHRVHGIGVYEGLEVMPIDGVDSEFIRLKYKDNDRLFLPVYRVGQLQKFSGPTNDSLIDKLGGTGWAKTQTKVKAHLRDIADSLLKLYAARAGLTRPPFTLPDEDYFSFENSFPFEETEDQLRAISDVVTDLTKERPMDRLICGDVGFGKTEVAMRAAFKVVQEGKQVAIVAPTTILTFQHGESFKRRFAKWPVTIRVLNRFISTAEAKKTLALLKDGKVDILIGTHRLFSRDVQFKDLGLLIIDEEQKFGVTHKEKIRQMRESVDTLAMSATPIPRTLNMSLVGIRDLSLINTPPEDRLPTRTFVCKYDTETIRKGIRSELARGGQVFFLHNRVQSIHEAAAKVREAVPEARISVGHGQMDEHELEKTMLAFFNHEIDVLVCTAIIESGMDIPKANTIFIDNAQNFGVSQLYQLRGRVGRSKERAYCYLLVPPEKKLDKDAQERVRIIQENTALGSGIRVAQYDLELRGAGDILGASQSGHINAVGYELYLELLEDAIRERKGEVAKAAAIEPEINLRIPAFIPDKYIPDIRVRLSYYKALSQIQSADDLDRIEDEFKDQFGPPPEQVINLMGLMLIRKVCKDLGVKDISAGKNTLTLSFTDQTPLPPQEVVRLSTRENKKFSITPDHRLKIKMNEITWPRVHEELLYLVKLCPKMP